MNSKTSFIVIILLLSLNLYAQDKSEKNFNSTQIKKAMLKATKWQLKNPRHHLYDWTNGAFYAGISAAYKTTGKKRYLRAMMNMGEENQWKPGPRLHHADDHAICQTYIDVYRIKGDEQMIKPTIEVFDEFMTTPYKTGKFNPITWWWCDALFMAPPTLIKLGVTLNEPKYMEYCDKLYLECYDLLFDQQENLFARDIKYKTDAEKPIFEANGEKIFWSRGNGWVMGGLALLLTELPKNYKNRPFYEELFTKMANKLAKIQQADGLWRSSLLDPEAYPGGETSGSGFYCFALTWAINNDLLDEAKFLPVVKKAWNGLNTLIQKDGHVGWVQPIGANPKKNFSSESWEVYGTGAFLLAGSEILKLKN